MTFSVIKKTNSSVYIMISFAEFAPSGRVPRCSPCSWWMCDLCEVILCIKVSNKFILLPLHEVGVLMHKFGISVNSDKPGNHNFDLLRKLVLPDGSVLRAKLPGRPTRDCLFADPARDRTRFVLFTSLYAFPKLC